MDKKKETTWKERQIDYLKFRYGDYVEFCKKAEKFDDRCLMVRIYCQIVEALNSLDDEPIPFVCVAINNSIEKEMKTMDSIVKRIEEGLWGSYNGFKYMKKTN